MKRAVALLLLLLPGCYRIHYITHARPDPAPTDERWHHDIIAGLIELSDPVDVSTICPQGLGRVDNQVSVPNWLAAVGVQILADTPVYIASAAAFNNDGRALTIPFQLWSPTTVSVTCGASTNGLAGSGPLPGPPPMIPSAPGSLAQAGVRTEARPKKVAVLDLQAEAGVDPGVASLMTIRLSAAIQLRTQASVISSRDVQTALGFERSKRLLGCVEGSCMAELGGALGVDLVVSGALGRLGRSITFDAQVMDINKAIVIHRYSHRRQDAGGDEAFLDEIDPAVSALFPTW